MINWHDWISSPSIVGEMHSMQPPHAGRKIGKSIVHRDQIHGDVQYDQLSAKLLNTEALQRLGRILQLGYSHLVFRGGTHTRLSHVMGAAYMAGSIVDTLQRNYTQPRAAQPLHVASPSDFLPGQGSESDRWDVLRHLVTWAALLHDLGHVPLGHTLEDEFEGIFKKHDDFASPRTEHLWGEKSEAFEILTDSTLYPASFERCEIKPRSVWLTVLLICFYKDITPDKDGRYHDFRSFLEYRKKSIKSGQTFPRAENNSATRKVRPSAKKGRIKSNAKNDDDDSLELTAICNLLEGMNEADNIYRPYLTDIVANTICADYLDYVKRDPTNVGLDVLHDNRILSNFYVSTEPRSNNYRMALALLDSRGKPRLDVCTGVVEQVRQRYRFAETIYYHKTKVSASAMFARSMTLIGKPNELQRITVAFCDAPGHITKASEVIARGDIDVSEIERDCLPNSLMSPEMGDEALHLFLMQSAIKNIKMAVNSNVERSKKNKRTAINTNANAEYIERQLRGLALLQAITRRKLYKVGATINAKQFGQLTKGASPDSVVEDRLKQMLLLLRDDRKSKDLRARIERDMADAAGLPGESILIYVPPRKSQAKGIETFAFDKDGVVRLNEHPAVSEKVNELSKDYQNLWRLMILIHPEYQDRVLDFSAAIDILVKELWSNFGIESSDIEFNDEKRIATIREISRTTYIRKDHREAALVLQRLCGSESEKNAPINWALFERGPILTTKEQETLSSVEYAERAFLLNEVSSRIGRKNSENEAIRLVGARFPAVCSWSSQRSMVVSSAKARHHLNGKYRAQLTDQEILAKSSDLREAAEDILSQIDLERDRQSKKTAKT